MTKIYGKCDIYNFKILIEENDNLKAFDFLEMLDGNLKILSQITNITREKDKLIGHCRIIGYRDGNGILRNLKVPPHNKSRIIKANEKIIKDVISFNVDERNFIGTLDNYNKIKISLDLEKIIPKHIAVLAKSGSGKSYTVGVILEEAIKENIPIVILDPHGEYGTLRFSNDNKNDLEKLQKLNLKPKGFENKIKEYSPDININKNCEKILLDIKSLQSKNLIECFPKKLTNTEQNLIYAILSSTTNINFDELIYAISNNESQSKWGLISALENLKKMNLFSEEFTKLDEIVKSGKVSIVNLKGLEPIISEIFVSAFLRDLFDKRKKNEIEPFLLVIEEAHNFCPERSFGETKSSKIIRTISAEGRKFGMGVCAITQRPAKIDKNVLSQCSTQIILKVTNPNDLKSIISSSEGADSTTEKEIQKLNIGTCLLTGIVDTPLKVIVRPKITKHGGETVFIKKSSTENKNLSKDKLKKITSNIIKQVKNNVVKKIIIMNFYSKKTKEEIFKELNEKVKIVEIEKVINFYKPIFEKELLKF